MARCPFLIVEEDGRYNYRYYCKLSGRYLGDFHDKPTVDNLCDKDHVECPRYKEA